MAEFSAEEIIDFENTYNRSDGDGLMVKCPGCSKDKGCSESDCPNIIGLGEADDIGWYGDFGVFDEIYEKLLLLVEDKPNFIHEFDWVPKWLTDFDEGDGRFILLDLLRDNHPYIKIYEQEPDESSRVSSWFYYVFLSPEYRVECLDELEKFRINLECKTEAECEKIKNIEESGNIKQKRKVLNNNYEQDSLSAEGVDTLQLMRWKDDLLEIKLQAGLHFEATISDDPAMICVNGDDSHWHMFFQVSKVLLGDVSNSLTSIDIPIVDIISVKNLKTGQEISKKISGVVH